jgi:prepilin-type N-terminal cleavage/methylation domain-containing protein
MRGQSSHNQGFTLIEMSIVLVIIGLVVGGVLLGQSLIAAAAVRAQITQIEQYNTAANTFREKYNALPGDMPSQIATQFGFTVGTGCTGAQGKRDGNGLLESQPAPYNQLQGEGEVALFWQDLSAVGLISGTFPNGGAAAIACPGGAYSYSLTPGTTFIGDYFPEAKIGGGNYVSVYGINGYNWFAVSALTAVTNATTTANTAIRVIDAYRIDTKIDDGFPATGNVQAQYEDNTGGVDYAPGFFSAFSDTPATCMSINASTQVRSYSISAAANGGIMPNCALSFRFQAGD